MIGCPGELLAGAHVPKMVAVAPVEGGVVGEVAAARVGGTSIREHSQVVQPVGGRAKHVAPIEVQAVGPDQGVQPAWASILAGSAVVGVLAQRHEPVGEVGEIPDAGPGDAMSTSIRPVRWPSSKTML